MKDVVKQLERNMPSELLSSNEWVLENGKLPDAISDKIDKDFATEKVTITILPPEIRTQYALATKIAEAAFAAISGNGYEHWMLYDGETHQERDNNLVKIATETEEKLISAILEYKLDRDFASMTFHNLDKMLQDDLTKTRQGMQVILSEAITGREYSVVQQFSQVILSQAITRAIAALESSAVSYLEKAVAKEFDKTPIEEIPGKCQSSLERIHENQKFLRQAFSNVEAATQREIELLIRQAEIRGAIKMFDEVEPIGEMENEGFGGREQRQKSNGLNREVATLFFYYLFKGFAFSIENKKQAGLIEFLTGYSKAQITKLYSQFEAHRFESENKKEINKKFFEDMKIVRKQFDLLGLSESSKLLDAYLGEET